MGQEPPSVIPGRPSAADPARLTAPGFVEVEVGVSSTHERSEIDVLETPILLKYSLSPHVQLRFGAAGLVRPLRGGGSTEFSDLSLGVQGYFLEQARVGVDIAVRGTVNVLNLQHNTLHPDLSFLLLLSKDLNAVHVDANAGFTHFSHRASFPRNEVCWAVALDGPVSEVIGWATEIRAAHSSADDPVFGLLAATFEAKSSLVLDVGVEFGLNESAPRYKVLGGLTFLLR
ncbi:MAG: hypothetical protein ACE5H0_10955 [Bacteroidota bacterium]